MKKCILSLMLISALLLTFSCSAKRASDSSYYDAGYSENLFRAESQLAAYGEGRVSDVNDDILLAPEEPSAPAYADMTNPEEMERKLVKRANIRIRVEDLAATGAFISDLMRKYGAYSASTEIVEDSSYRYSLRVPSTKYDAFLGDMDGIGRTLHRNETTEDVTANY